MTEQDISLVRKLIKKRYFGEVEDLLDREKYSVCFRGGHDPEFLREFRLREEEILFDDGKRVYFLRRPLTDEEREDLEFWAD
jgi:hypothetical protein